MIKNVFCVTLLLSVALLNNTKLLYASYDDSALEKIIQEHKPKKSFPSFRYDPDVFGAEFSKIPHSYSLENYSMGIKDQKNISACASFAITQALEIRKNIDAHYALSPFAKEWQIKTALKNQYEAFSPIFLYTASRWRNETLHTSDNGMSLKENLLTLQKYGIGRERVNPFQNTLRQIQRKPSTYLLQDAKNQIDLEKLSIRSVHKDWDSITAALWSKMPLVFSIDTYESMESEDVQKNGILVVPDVDQEEQKEAHALTPVGFGFPDPEDNEPYLKVINSWGPYHGAHGTIFNEKKTQGFLWLPKEYVLDKSLSYQIFGIEHVVPYKKSARSPRPFFQ